MKRPRAVDVTYYEWSVIRWLTSRTRAQLAPEGRYIFRELIDQCYIAGGIPRELDLMARRADCTEEQMRRVWPQIERHFRQDKHDKNTLVFPPANAWRRSFFTYVSHQRTIGSRGGKNRGRTSIHDSNGIASARLSQSDTTDTTNTIQSDTTASAAKPPLALPPQSEWPLSIRSVQMRFPDTDEPFALQIVQAAVQAYASESDSDWPAITDEVIARAVQEASKNKKQHSAALYMKTVPQVIRTWCREEALNRAR